MLRRVQRLIAHQRTRDHTDVDAYPIAEAMATLRVAIADTTDGHEITPPTTPRSD